jgi:HEPN domain-containing protein
VEEIIDIEHLTNIVAFHCQQAIEKTFKAVLEEYDEVPRIHNLVRLYNLVRNRLNLTVDELVLREISDTYIDARYPGELGLLPYGKPTLKDAERFYDIAKIVYDNVEQQISD